MPADLRATDQDVAVFVRSLAGDLGAQRSRALELAVESSSHGAYLPAPVPRAVAEEDVDALKTSGAGRIPSPAPRRTGRLRGIVMWSAVFATSVWILIAQWRNDPPPAVSDSAPPVIVRSAGACPAPTLSTPVVPMPNNFATPAMARPQRPANRSSKP
jgi:hypothetical protein